MADFLEAYKITDHNEAGWANDKDDRGKETWDGISRVFWPHWIGWDIIDHYKNLPGFPENLRASSELQKAKKEFYRLNFWNAIRGSEINNQEEANRIYDRAVNTGPGEAIILAKRSLGIIPETSHFDDNLLNHLNHTV